jgi:hypothetical protein
MPCRTSRSNGLIAFLTLLVSANGSAQIGPLCTEQEVEAYIVANYPGFNTNLYAFVSYSESLSAPAPTGTVVSKWETILQETKTNCTKQPQTYSITLQFTDHESMTHQKSGELGTQVALKVGQKDAGDLELSTAKTESNGWQVTASKNIQWSSTTSGTLGPCSAIKYIHRGKRKDGAHSGFGWVDWTVRFRNLFSTSQFSITGQCKNTNSEAIGKKFYVSYASRTDPVNADCPAGAACKKCTTISGGSN